MPRNHSSSTQFPILLALVSIFSTLMASNGYGATGALCGDIFSAVAVVEYTARDNVENDRRLNDIKDELDTADRNSDEHFRFLKRVGLRKNIEGRYTLDINSAVEIIQSEIEAAIASGKIRRDQALFPVRIYQEKSKTVYQSSAPRPILLLHPGEPVPEGYEIFNGLLPSGEFYRMLAKGKFPIGQVLGLTTQLYSVKEGVLLHDFAHISAMMTDYHYMAQVRKAAHIMRNEPGAPQSDEARLNFQKFEYFVEFMNLMNPAYQKETLSAVNKIKSKLGLGNMSSKSFKSTGQDSTPHSGYLKAISDAIMAADEPIRQNILNLSILSEMPNYWLPYGAAIRPVELRFGATENLKKIIGSSFMMIEDRPDLILNFALKTEDSAAKMFRDVTFPMAHLLTTLELLSQVNSDDIFEALFSDMSKPSLALEELCNKGFAGMVCTFVRKLETAKK